MNFDPFTIRGETFHVASWPAQIAATAIDFTFCHGIAAVAPARPPRRPLDVKDPGDFILEKYSHGKRPPT